MNCDKKKLAESSNQFLVLQKGELYDSNRNTCFAHSDFAEIMIEIRIE
jgi:hypothetical protein